MHVLRSDFFGFVKLVWKMRLRIVILSSKELVDSSKLHSTV